MSLNNNLSILPFYRVTSDNPTPQDCQKWWHYGKVWPLITSGIPPFQLNTLPSEFTLCPAEPNIGSEEVISITPTTKVIGGRIMACFEGDELPTKMGRYYLKCGISLISDVFTIVRSDVLKSYLKIEWWDDEDFTTDDGTIIYTDGNGDNVYKNVLYLQSDLAKPEYVFEEEGENRDGYFFPIKQISEKRYKFKFLAPEYILDVMRFIRMSDHIEITYRGKVYVADTFLMTPTWEAQGDLASVDCEFDTNTVAKRIGRIITAPPVSREGDFNDDFNNDFLNS